MQHTYSFPAIGYSETFSLLQSETGETYIKQFNNYSNNTSLDLLLSLAKRRLRNENVWSPEARMFFILKYFTTYIEELKLFSIPFAQLLSHVKMPTSWKLLTICPVLMPRQLWLYEWIFGMKTSFLILI